jgi:hypothetical protein
LAIELSKVSWRQSYISSTVQEVGRGAEKSEKAQAPKAEATKPERTEENDFEVKSIST